MTLFETVYDHEAIPCICKTCDLEAAPNSEMCGACEYLGCTATEAKHD